jgi:hypothetical protein
MSTFLDDKYYTDNDKSILNFMEEIYKNNSSQWLQFMYEGDIDTRYAAGDQEAIYNYVASTYAYYRRNQINFNHIRRIRNMISGYQRLHRKTSIVIPQEERDQKTADQLSALLMWTMNRANAYEVQSKCFEGALTVGMNLMQISLDYLNDPLNGDIRVNPISYNQFVIDPFFKNLDLSDCNYIWTRKWLSKSNIKSLLPGRDKDIDALPQSGTRDGKFPYMPESLNYWSSHLFPYDEFYYRTMESKNMLLDRNTGETLLFDGEDQILDMMLAKYPQVELIKREMPSIKYAIVVNNRVFYNGKNPVNIDKFPFVPFVAYFEPEIPYFYSRIQGIVRDLRNPQWCYNHMMRSNLDYRDAGVNRGYKFVEDSVVDSEDLLKGGVGTNIAIKKGHTPDEVQDIMPPQIPSSWFQEIEKLQNDIMQISGVNEELMGSAEDDKAGILSMLRQGAGLVTLQPLFDNLDFSQKLLGSLFLEVVQNNFSVGKIERILGEEASPLIKEKSFLKFDCQVVEGTLTPTQQKMEFLQLIELQQMGLPIPPEILLKNAPLQNKQDLIDSLTKQMEGQSKQQQQQLELQLAELKAKTELANARAYADTGLGAERVARIPENRALAMERSAEAEKDRDLGTLHKVQALKELQGMDIEHLGRIVEILQSLKAGRDEKENQSAPVEKQKKAEEKEV